MAVAAGTFVPSNRDRKWAVRRALNMYNLHTKANKGQIALVDGDQAAYSTCALLKAGIAGRGTTPSEIAMFDRFAEQFDNIWNILYHDLDDGDTAVAGANTIAAYQAVLVAIGTAAGLTLPADYQDGIIQEH